MMVLMKKNLSMKAEIKSEVGYKKSKWFCSLSLSLYSFLTPKWTVFMEQKGEVPDFFSAEIFMHPPSPPVQCGEEKQTGKNRTSRRKTAHTVLTIWFFYLEYIYLLHSLLLLTCSSFLILSVLVCSSAALDGLAHIRPPLPSAVVAWLRCSFTSVSFSDGCIF